MNRFLKGLFGKYMGRPPSFDRRLGASAISVGTFDGVHRGHRQLLAQLRRSADAMGLPTAVITFDPHPLEIIAPDRAPKKLCSLQERLQRLMDTGYVDVVEVLTFDGDRRNQSADAFVSSLVDRFGLKLLVVGENFAIGRDRQGDIQYLERLGRMHGFDVQPVTLAVSQARTISSTNIRQLVLQGAFDDAAEALGRPYLLDVRLLGCGHGVLLAEPSEDACLPLPGSYVAHMNWRQLTREIACETRVTVTHGSPPRLLCRRAEREDMSFRLSDVTDAKIRFGCAPSTLDLTIEAPVHSP